MSTLNIEDEKEFHMNHLQQLDDALNIWVKYMEIHDYEFKKTKDGKIYYFSGINLWYNDTAIKDFLEKWSELEHVDRTFHIIDMQVKYERELRFKRISELSCIYY